MDCPLLPSEAAMKEQPDNFNLLKRPWIPVLYANGKTDRIGIRKALTEAGRIRQIAASNPVDNVALIRLLVAVFQWCKPILTNEDFESLERSGGIPPDWLIKLENHQGLFCLLGDSDRFMQASDGAVNPRPVADLFHELPGATNVVHFRHIRDYREGTCPGCIAIGLARLPVAITGKGAGKRRGINGDPPVYFVPMGNSLTETLILNWAAGPEPGDEPCWTGRSSVLEADAPISSLEGFTWTPRQFRIDDHSLQAGSCMICGTRTDTLVTRLHELNKPNGREELSGSKEWRDPHLAYATDGKSIRAKDAEKHPTAAAGQWRKWLTATVQATPEEDQPPEALVHAAHRIGGELLSVLVAGLATRKDKCVECCESRISIAATLLNEDAGKQFGSKIRELDEAIERTLDPRSGAWAKPVGKLKESRLLKSLAAHGGRKLHALRSALADRLPMFEYNAFGGVSKSLDDSSRATVPLACTADDLSEVLDGAVQSSTTGSPLRRLEAKEQARQALNRELAKLAAEADKRETQVDGTDKPSPSKKG